jgi:hypothetical protein
MLALALCCGASFAACLLDDYSVSAEFSRSAVVALARVVSERQVPEQKEAGLLDGTLYSLRVQETYRGQASRTRSVFSENSSGRFPMVVGQTYIVFLYLQSGRLSADYCGNSGLASDKQNVVNEVRAAARVR